MNFSVDNLIIIQLILPLTIASICAAIDSRKIAFILAVTTLAINCFTSGTLLTLVTNLGVVNYRLGNFSPSIGIELELNVFNTGLLLLVSIIGLLVVIQKPAYFDDELSRSKQTLGYSLLLLHFFGLFASLLSNDIFNIYVAIEITSITAYSLVALNKDRYCLLVAYDYLIIGSIAASLILLGIGLIYANTGTLNINELIIKVRALWYLKTLKFGLLLITFGCLIKIGFFPIHQLIAKLYQYSTSLFGLTFIGATSKVNIYYLVKLVFLTAGHALITDYYIKIIIEVLACLTIIICSLRAIFSESSKRILSFSSIAQISYIILALVQLDRNIISAAIILIIAHSLVKVTLFTINNSLEFSHSEVKKNRLLFVALIISCFNLLGMPISLNFIAKWQLVVSIINIQRWDLLIVILFASILTLIYVWKLFNILNSMLTKKTSLQMSWQIYLLTIINIGAIVKIRAIFQYSDLIANYLIKKLC